MSGAANFFLADCERDELVQLTDHTHLNVRRGSYYVDSKDRLYYWRPPELIRLDLDSRESETIWAHPPRAFSSIPAVNRDARLLVVTVQEHPTLDLRKLRSRRVMNLEGIDKTPRQIMLETTVRAIGIDLATGRGVELLRALPCGCGYAVWNPVNPNRCWIGIGREANPGPSIVVVDWDGSDAVRKWAVGPKTDAELFDHVFWSADGDHIMFKYRAKCYGEESLLLRSVKKALFELGRVDASVEFGDVQSVPLPFRNTHINHVPGKPWLIGDGGFIRPEEQHVYRIDIKPAGCEFTSLAYHGNRPNPDWPYLREGYGEPNVKANPQGDAISFTCSPDSISPDVFVLMLDRVRP